MLEFADAQKRPAEIRSDDEFLGRFLRHAGEHMLATVPSLVEHEDMVASLIGLRPRGGEDPGRVAACWIGDCEGCASEIDWTYGP